MIHLFNRKELITVLSQQQAYAIQSALSCVGIAYHAKIGTAFFTAGRSRGVPGIDWDATDPIVIYVKKEDYPRAQIVIAPILRG